MKWVSCISQEPNTPAAIDALIAEVGDSLDADKPNTLLVFSSPHHARDLDPQRLMDGLGASTLLGCTGSGIIGAKSELEEGPALAVLAGALPNGHLTSRHIAASDLPSGDDPEAVARWRELLPDDAPHDFIVLANPLSVGDNPWLSALDRAFEGNKIGGLISGSQTPSGLRLFVNGAVHDDGVALLSVGGSARLDPIIAQGCKPIGDPMLITSCEDNRIYALDQKKPASVLRTLYQSLDEDEQSLFRSSLFVGLQMKDQVEYKSGDFLIRNLLGVLPDRETIAVGAAIDRWQVLQFHLRDRETATADLHLQLQRYADSNGGSSAGALLFSCLGRGAYLFDTPNHDSDAFRKRIGEVPLAGFFCNGEIGPVGGRTYSHGYTSAFGVFTER